MKSVFVNKINIFNNLMAISAIVLFITVWSTQVFLNHKSTLIQKSAVNNNAPSPKPTDTPWKNSVCGNGICEPCESSSECCNYPCSKDQNGKEVCRPPVCQGSCPGDCDSTPENSWKRYINNKYGYEFKYPDKLNLTVGNDIPTLGHTIPYKNTGDCDMIGGNTLYDRFTDFSMTFEVTDGEVIPAYNDGPYKQGMLDGVVQYYGAEGCGPIFYYFPIAGDRTLRIERNLVQAFTGISSYWNVEEILAVPGVITQKESDILFGQILSTFKVN